MKLKNGLVTASEFNSSLKKLVTIEMSAKDCLSLAKAVRVIQQQQEDVRSTREAIIKQHCILGDDGNPQTKDNQAVFKSDEDKKAAFQKVTDILNEEFEIPLEKPIEIDGEVKLTPGDYLVLEGLIDIVSKPANEIRADIQDA